MHRHVHLLLALVAGFVGSIIALTFVVTTSGVWAQLGSPSTSKIPSTVSFQGYLSSGNGGGWLTSTVTMRFALYEDPTGGEPLWEETQPDVEVRNGFFSVLLGSVEPLDADFFSGPERYLGVTVDTGDGPTELPRQVLASVPYAFQAQAAENATTALRANEALSATTALSASTALSATTVPWSGLSDIPADIADGDDVGSSYANVIVVAKSGGDYTSVAEALATTSDASISNRYLVWVAPGVYNETQTSVVDSYVHLQGAGPNVTQIVGEFTGPQTPASAVVQLNGDGRVSDIGIVNTGTSQLSYGIFSSGFETEPTVDNVVVRVTGSGGQGHIALWTSDTNMRVSNSYFEASGAAGTGATNAAIGVTTTTPPNAQPIITTSTMRGNGGTFGIFSNASSPDLYDVDIRGVGTGIRATGSGGFVEVHSSVVEGFTNYASVANGSNGNIQIGGSMLMGNFDESTGTIVCAQVWGGNYSPSDSTCPSLLSP
jgi:hypothetical protein